MQPTDRDEVSALVRELVEELSAVVTVGQPVLSIENASDSNVLTREIFFVCRLHAYSLSGGRGPEWKNKLPNNQYFVEAIEMNEVSLRAANLLPVELVELIIAAADPWELPSIDI
jgi:hypothetical protein